MSEPNRIGSVLICMTFTFWLSDSFHCDSEDDSQLIGERLAAPYTEGIAQQKKYHQVAQGRARMTCLRLLSNRHVSHQSSITYSQH